ncbi:DUF6457 domain-containing protein [Planctomonas psychrotolerans]|uniref:DUF6457 domain-containing protein n=1 Tax=Planctomonas psychrotolerans TaxID=2528712 RepID=UPI00123A66E3|nr:DUF6457 domain-containing protein [Planctomonas psychrotolerans]
MTSEPPLLDAWAAELARALDLPQDFATDVPLVLDLARDAAHSVARPAAPVTTFLVGYAAALRGGSVEDVERATEIATRLALAHADPEEPSGS